MTSSIASLYAQRRLIWRLVQRDVAGRYRGSSIGLFWTFVSPLMLLAIFTFVFNDLLKAKWGLGEESRAQFALTLFAGLLIHNAFAESITRAPGLILGAASFVKRTRFPLELLPVGIVGASFVHMTIGFGALLAFFFAVHGYVHATALYLPLVLLPLAFYAAAAAWTFAALGVYVRDLNYVAGLLATAMMFLSPVFYSLGAIPAEYRRWFYLNPLTNIIEQTRNVVIWGSPPEALGLFWGTAFGALAAWLGLLWFNAARRGFADVV